MTTLFTITLFIKNIKNRFHNIIHTFKNYFVTVFSVFSKINYIQTDSYMLNPKKKKKIERLIREERLKPYSCLGQITKAKSVRK